MTNEQRARVVKLIHEEHGFVGFVAERLERPAETRALIDGDPECREVLDYEQSIVTSEDAVDRASAACLRQASTNPDIRRLVEVRLRERRHREQTDEFMQRVLSPPSDDRPN